jgi:hypothetical protein
MTGLCATSRFPRHDIDSDSLPRLLADQGFVPPDGFKALVVEVVPGTDGAFTNRYFDYSGTSADRENWWPASNIKIFAAVAALEVMKKRGFTPRAKVTFEYDEKPVTRTVQWLVRQAITPSNNVAFDQLVEIVGFDAINAWFQQTGLVHTVLRRGYSHRVMDPEFNVGTLRENPRIVLDENGRQEVIPARHGISNPDCPNNGNCTTLQDLADILRRVMLHESLPACERFDLDGRQLALLRSALEAPRPRGLGVVNGLKEAFGSLKVRCFHKPGFAMNWFSDAVFVLCPDGMNLTRRWIVVMAGLGGRDVIDDAARRVGALIASGRLSRLSQNS